MNMQQAHRIPPWATLAVVGVTSFLLVMFVNDIRTDMRDMKSEIKSIGLTVTRHTAVFEGYEASLREIKARLEKLEGRQ